MTQELEDQIEGIEQPAAPPPLKAAGIEKLAELVGLPPGYTDFPGSDLYMQIPAKTGPAFCLLTLFDRACGEIARIIEREQSAQEPG